MRATSAGLPSVRFATALFRIVFFRALNFAFLITSLVPIMPGKQTFQRVKSRIKGISYKVLLIIAELRDPTKKFATHPSGFLSLRALTYTRFGRYVYMVGGNREAAEYSGVNVRAIIGSVMVISALCSGLAGMLGVAYFGSAQQEEFDSYLLDSIAAVVVGGTSLFGGQGGIGNTIIGLFVLGILNNGLDHVRIDSFLKVLIRGLILLIALIINVCAQRLRASRSPVL
jgi:ABC-type glucose/galactose transport system permease subunit